LASLTYLDTHVVAWLFADAVEYVPGWVCRFVDARDVRISPMVILELGLLYELGRVTEPPRVVVEGLRNRIGLQVCDDVPWSVVAEKALDMSWTRDPFDRVIVAHAAARDLPLVTKDETIRAHYTRAVWEKTEPRTRKRRRR
jgi:PIN domain nuclease of toxin-antitoxin system